MIFLMGWGNFRTNVGMARIWSPLANWGCLSRSMTSMWYCPAKCSSQIFFRFAKAARLLGVCPATYSRNSQVFSGVRDRVRAFGFCIVFPIRFLIQRESMISLKSPSACNRSDAAPGKIHGPNLNSLSSQLKGAYLVRMCHSARLQDEQAAMALSIALQISQAQPCIDQR